MLADFAASRSEVFIILSAVSAKIERRSKDDFKGRHFEAGLIAQVMSRDLHDPFNYRDIEEMLLNTASKSTTAP